MKPDRRSGPPEIPHQPGEMKSLWHRPQRLQPFEFRSNNERLEAVWRETWCDTAAAKRARARIIGLWHTSLAREGRHHAILISTPQNGTTGVLRTLEPDFRAAGFGSPLLTAMPAGGGAMGLVDAILGALHPYRTANRSPAYMREFEMFQDLKAAKPGAIVIDRAENLRLMGAGRAGQTLDYLLHVGGRAGVPFILATPPGVAARLMEVYNTSKLELAWTFRPVPLALQRVDEEYLALLDHWEGMLPLRHTSDLAQREMALHLYALCDGKVGVLAAVLRRAAAEAIRTGAERITFNLLDDMGLEQARSFKSFRF